MEDEQSKEPANSRVPVWHTAALVALIVSVALVGSLLGHGDAGTRASSGQSRVMTVYLPMLAVNFGLLVYVSRVGRAKNSLPSLLGARASELTRVPGDLALAALAVVLILATELAWQRIFGSFRNADPSALLPQTLVERFAWVMVAASVGFCEEVVYRGYLRAELARFTRRAPLGIVLQAALFGIAHANQGAATAARFLVYGFGFGVLAHQRRSLVPGILAHVTLDLLAGLAR
jgi:membrane protease YdiL (CAAX protease family)